MSMWDVSGREGVREWVGGRGGNVGELEGRRGGNVSWLEGGEGMWV